MTTDVIVTDVDQIGQMAGDVWKRLADSGPMTLSRLSREFNVPRDLVMHAVGWLAREGKVKFHAGARYKQVALVDDEVSATEYAG